MVEEIIAAAAPAATEIITEGVFATSNEVDLTAVLDKLQQIIDINTSIYAFVSYFVVIFFGSVVVYLILRPLLSFFR